MSEIVTIVAVLEPSESAVLQLEGHGGDILPASGGGLSAVFASVTDAVAAAIAVQNALSEGAGHMSGLQIGIEVVETTSSVNGQTRVPTLRANALAGLAMPGQILATGLVESLASGLTNSVFEPYEAPGSGDQFGPIFSVNWRPEPAPQLLRVVVADDAALIRSGLVQLLESAGFVVTADVGDADALLAAVVETPPDLVVTDIRMPPTNTNEGLVAAAAIRRDHPGVAVLVLSQHIEARAATTLLDGRPAGIGYLLKERVSDLAEFVDACSTIANGGSVIDPIVADQLIQRRQHDEKLARLSDREAEVLALMARGLSNGSIAAELFVGIKTIETHIRSIFQKLDIVETPEGNRRVQAVLELLDAAETGTED